MSQLLVSRNRKNSHLAAYVLISLYTVMLCYSPSVFAGSTVEPAAATMPLSIQATHLLGFENVKSNRNGVLSLHDNELQFQEGGKPVYAPPYAAHLYSGSVAQVKIDTIQAVFLGEESKQVGGLMMKLGKAAAPYGAGRAVSLFAHKKYDTLTVEYADDNGALHGAIFQVGKGQGEHVRYELMARRLSSSSGKGQPSKQETAEVIHEGK